ncbi:Hsp20/alpha crystallin family protein [bacterium]|nr:Hsp20/alpha crystallin family protein [bacterium]
MSDFFEKLAGSEKLKEEKTKKPIEEEKEEGELAVDVFQTDNEIIIQSTIAGVKAEDLDITIQNDMISIRGERKREIEVPPENYFYQECYWGPFSRQIILPEEIDVEKVEARLKNGILTLILPKAQKTKTTRIKVKEAE